MKKLTLPYLFALCASAPFALALPISGDLPISETLKATDAVTVSEAGTMSAETGSNAEFYFQEVNQTTDKETNQLLATFNSNYTFDLPTYVTINRGTDTNTGKTATGNTFPKFLFAQGTTVTFNNFNITGTNLSRRAGLIFDMVKRTTNDNLKAHLYVKNGSANTFNTVSGTQENWIRNIHFHAMSAGNYGDVHMQHNASFHIETNGVEFVAFRLRQPYQYAASRDAIASDPNIGCSGKLYLNGYSTTIGTIQWNSSQQATTHAGAAPNDFYLDFGENSNAQYICFNAFGEHDPVKQNDGTYRYQNNWANNRWYVDNFGENDVLVFANDPFNTQIVDGTNAEGTGIARSSLISVLSKMLVINGEYINDQEILGDMIIKLTAEDLAKYGFTDTSLVGKWAIIPEPSTYAIILGALALGFVAYRRRK